MDTDDADPTIIFNILKDFRKSADNYYRSSMLPLNVTNDKSTGSFAKPRHELDRSGDAKSGIPEKKIKLSTPNNQASATEGI